MTPRAEVPAHVEGGRERARVCARHGDMLQAVADALGVFIRW